MGHGFIGQSWLAFWQALRSLRQSRGFSAVAILSLGLGIGASAAVFSALDAVLLRSLPVVNPRQIVILGFTLPQTSEPIMTLSYPFFERLRVPNAVFSEAIAYRPLRVAMRGSSSTERIAAELVSGNYFSALGVQPLMGRFFTNEVDKPGAANSVAVLSYGFWKRKIGGDPSILGHELNLNGQRFSVIGIAPPAFFGLEVGAACDMRIPASSIEAVLPGSTLLRMHNNFSFVVAARMRPGIPFADLQRRADGLFYQIAQQEAEEEPRIQFLINQHVALQAGERGLSGMRRQFSGPLLVLMGLVGMLLLIGCANMASASLARATARQKDVALRLALGAERSHVIRLLLTESLLLAFAAGAFGIVFAAWTLQLLPQFFTGNTSVLLDLHIDFRVFVFTFAVSALAGLLFGLAPALQTSKPDLLAALQDRTLLGFGRSVRRANIRHILVTCQLALSLVLLVGAGIFVSTLWNLRRVDTGLKIDGVLEMSTETDARRYRPEQNDVFYSKILSAAEEIPGILSASLALNPVFTFPARDSLTIGGRMLILNENLTATVNAVAPRFFETLGVPFLAGRDFNRFDTRNSPKVAIVTESLVRQFFPSSNPIGKQIGVGSTFADREIVGVVKDARFVNVRARSSRTVFLPITQSTGSTAARTLYVRAEGNPNILLRPVQAAIREIDNDVPVYDSGRLQARGERSVAQERLVAGISGFFGMMALLLTAIGIYGLFTYETVRRTREIGIRLALGAHPRRVISMFIIQSLALAFLGIILGLPIAILLWRSVREQLFKVTPQDPAIVVGAVVCLLAIALTAALIPALRISSLALSRSLRYE